MRNAVTWFMEVKCDPSNFKNQKKLV